MRGKAGGGCGNGKATAALATAFAGGIGRVRLKILMPAAARKIASMLRCWGCLPGNLLHCISNGNNKKTATGARSATLARRWMTAAWAGFLDNGVGNRTTNHLR